MIPSLPAKAGNPVLTGSELVGSRALRGAAAYWIARFAGDDVVLCCYRNAHTHFCCGVSTSPLGRCSTASQKSHLR
jgi:hypothetical protein